VNPRISVPPRARRSSMGHRMARGAIRSPWLCCFQVARFLGLFFHRIHRATKKEKRSKKERRLLLLLSTSFFTLFLRSYYKAECAWTICPIARWGAIQSATELAHLFIHASDAAGAQRLQILGDGTPSSRFRQHTVNAWRLQSHFELHPRGVGSGDPEPLVHHRGG
jgi:hypothetical protein